MSEGTQSEANKHNDDHEEVSVGGRDRAVHCGLDKPRCRLPAQSRLTGPGFKWSVVGSTTDLQVQSSAGRRAAFEQHQDSVPATLRDKPHDKKPDKSGRGQSEQERSSQGHIPESDF